MAVDLTGTLRTGRRRHRDLEPGHAVEQSLDERPLAGPGWTRYDEHGPRRQLRLPAVVEELDELGPLALGETADRLRLADPALVEEPCRLHAPELRNGHEHVEHLRRLDPLGRVEQDRLDALATRLEVSL